jgi:NADPH:quinone reductase
MRAIEVAGGSGGPEALRPIDLPLPEPGPGQVRIRVAAAGVNRPDLLQRQGLYPPPPGASPVLGLEVAGVIDAVGEGVTRWRGGERVCALLSGGGYAEAAVAEEGSVLPIPDGVSIEDAAGLPETVFTVWTNVFEDGRLAPGETLMVHGATSGIGSTALQMARAHGCRVIATSRGATKARGAAELGADISLDLTRDAWPEDAADVILDMVGGDYLSPNVRALKVGGRLVQIATLGGREGRLDLARLMTRRLTLTGSTLRNRAPAEKARIGRSVEATVWPWVAEGRLRPVIDRVYPLAEAAEAHRRLESGAHLGKVILRVEAER